MVGIIKYLQLLLIKCKIKVKIVAKEQETLQFLQNFLRFQQQEQKMKLDMKR